MIYEAVITSAVRGLKGGRTGFQPVMRTKGLRDDVLRRLESLSVYRHTSRQGSGQNPVIFNFHRLTTGIGNLAVISRTVDAGNDYSNRSNKCSHLVAFTEDEMRRFASTTPAALIANNIANFSNTWPGDPEERNHPLTINATKETFSQCNLWDKHFGDAAWAAFLAERAQKKQPTILIAEDCSPESCQLIFDLIRESTALLPADSRWATTFETTIIGTSDAIIQGTYKGSPESEQSRHGVLSLTIGEPPSDIDLNTLPLSEKARTGEEKFTSNPQRLDKTPEAVFTSPARTPKKPPPLLKTPSTPQLEQASNRKKNFYVALAIAILLVFVVASTGLLFVGSKLLPILFPNSQKRVCEYADFNHLKGGDEIPPEPTSYDWRRLRFVDTRQDAEKWAPSITKLLETDGLKSYQVKSWLTSEPKKKKEIHDLVNRISNGSASFDDYRKAAFFESVDDPLNKDILTSLAKRAFSTRDKKERIKKIKELTEWRSALKRFAEWRDSKQEPDPKLTKAVLESKTNKYLPTTDKEKWRKWQGVFRRKLKYNENLDSEKSLGELGRKFAEALKSLNKNSSNDIEVDQMKAVLMNLYGESDQFEDEMIARLYDHVKQTAEKDKPPLSLSETRDYIVKEDAAKKKREEITQQQQEQEEMEVAHAKEQQDALNRGWEKLKKIWNDQTQVSEPEKNDTILAGNIDGIASLFENGYVELHVFQPLNRPNYFHLKRSGDEHLWRISAGSQDSPQNIGVIRVEDNDLIFTGDEDADTDALFWFKHAPLIFSRTEDKGESTNYHSLFELPTTNDGILRATLKDDNAYEGLEEIFSAGVLEHAFEWDDDDKQQGNIIKQMSKDFNCRIRLTSRNPDCKILPFETNTNAQVIKLSNNSLTDEEQNLIIGTFSIVSKFHEHENAILLERLDYKDHQFGQLTPTDALDNDGQTRKFITIAEHLLKPFSTLPSAKMRSELEYYLAEICDQHTNTFSGFVTQKKNLKKQKEFFFNGLSDSQTSRAYLGTTLPNLKNKATRSWESILACFLVKTTTRYENKITYDDKNKQINKLPDSDWFFSEVENDKNIRSIAYQYLANINLRKCLNQLGKTSDVEAKNQENESRVKIRKWFAAYLYAALRPSFIIKRIEEKTNKEIFFNLTDIDVVVDYKPPESYSKKYPKPVQRIICQLRASDQAKEKVSNTR